MINLRTINPAREITTAGMRTLHGTATGTVVCEVADSERDTQVARLPTVSFQGLGGTSSHLDQQRQGGSRPSLKTLLGSRRTTCASPGRGWTAFQTRPQHSLAEGSFSAQMALTTTNEDTGK